MNAFCQLSDPHPLLSNSISIDKQETASPSDASTIFHAAHSDEEVLLATSRPKKRAGRRVVKETRHPIFRGVRKRNNNKWVCEMREPNKNSRIWLGTYPTPEMAARAHDVAALALRGKSACLNFSDSAWRLPVPVSNEAKDIKSAASKAAELFRPQEFSPNQITQFSVVESSSEACSNDCKSLQENVFYVDEEAMFDMPSLLMNMAEGPLFSPLHYVGDVMNWDDIENPVDVCFWNY